MSLKLIEIHYSLDQLIRNKLPWSWTMSNNQARIPSKNKDAFGWEELYKAEEKKYKKYIEATQISNLSELTQELSKNFSTNQILTDY